MPLRVLGLGISAFAVHFCFWSHQSDDFLLNRNGKSNLESNSLWVPCDIVILEPFLASLSGPQHPEYSVVVGTGTRNYFILVFRSINTSWKHTNLFIYLSILCPSPPISREYFMDAQLFWNIYFVTISTIISLVHTNHTQKKCAADDLGTAREITH